MRLFTRYALPRLIINSSTVFLLFFGQVFVMSHASANPYPVGNVSVLPVIFIPSDQSIAGSRWTNPKSRNNVHDYLNATQDKWRALLGGNMTFKMEPLFVTKGRKTAAEYAASTSPAAAVQTEVLPQIGVSTSNVMSQAMCNYGHIVLIMVVGAEFTVGTGGPWCSYANRSGPGAAFVGLDFFFNQGKLTSTMVHEVGHGMGLVHSWERPTTQHSITKSLRQYGQETSLSVMSYNTANQSNSTDASKVPGILLPVEKFELAHNKRTLPYYFFQGVLSHPEYSSFFRHPISSITSAKYNRNTMWQSPKVNELGWVSLGLTLPKTAVINRVEVFTGYSLVKRKADIIQIEVRRTLSDDYTFVAKVNASDGSTVLNFPATAIKELKISMHAKDGKTVVFRGARFYKVQGSSMGPAGLLAPATELYPPK